MNKKLALTFGILFALALILVSFTSLASASVTVHYNVYSATIEENGLFNTSTNSVSNLDVVGYVCLNSNCSLVGNSVSGLISHTNTNVMTVVFPTTLMNSNGYVLYFYKQGYIGWMQKANWNGNGETNSSAKIYLSKKRIGYSPIMNFSVVNEIAPNKPIEINVSAGIDADTYAALRDNRISGIDYQDSDKVNTTITLEIKNSAGVIVREERRNILMNPSSVENIGFEHTFTSLDNYTIRVYTDVTDAKIITSLRQEASKQIRVIEQNKTNYSYALVNGLNMVPAFPNINENVNFSFNFFSNYVSSNGSLSVLPVNVYSTIYRNGVLFENISYSAMPTSIINPTSFSFNRTFSQMGNYTLNILVSPNNSGEKVVDSTSLSFVIGNFTFHNETNQTNQTCVPNWVCSSWSSCLNNGQNRNCIDLNQCGNNSNKPSEDRTCSVDDDDEDSDDAKYGCTNDKLSGVSLPLTNYTVDLTNKPEVKNYRNFIYWIIMAVLALLILIILVYIFKFAK